MDGTRREDTRGRRALFLLLALAFLVVLRSYYGAGAANVIAVPDSTGDVGRYTSVALDAGGNPVISYFDATNADLKVLHCGNPTCTAGNSITAPDTLGAVGGGTSIALDPAGRPVVSYFDWINEDLKVLRCGNPTCTAGNTIVSPDTLGYVGFYTSLALDASGRPVVAYDAVFNGDVKILFCGNQTCTAGNTIAILDSAGDVGEFISMKLDASGHPVMAYINRDPVNGSLKVLRCGNPTCTSGNSVVSLDAGALPVFTSLAIDPAGNPVVAYRGSASGSESLKIVHCGNPGCTAGNSIQTLDASGTPGWISMALDGAGRPVISYSLGGLRILRCGDAYCATRSVALAEAGSNVGGHNALVLDALGNPVVSYFDSLSADLKVLHCDTVDCLPAPTPTPTVPVSATATASATPVPTATPRPAAGAIGGVVGAVLERRRFANVGAGSADQGAVTGSRIRPPDTGSGGLRVDLKEPPP